VLARLAEVPVEVTVQLGTLRIAFEQLRRLQPGTSFALPTFIDARVPIFVGGVLKAWGTPVVHRGVLSVAVEQVVEGRGGAR
jgi:flagellar motor switch/type III secretory pathway protein FliN